MKPFRSRPCLVHLLSLGKHNSNFSLFNVLDLI